MESFQIRLRQDLAASQLVKLPRSTHKRSRTRISVHSEYGINVSEIEIKTCRLSCDKAVEPRQYTFTSVYSLWCEYIVIKCVTFFKVCLQPVSIITNNPRKSVS